MNLANVSGVPFRFEQWREEHPACTPSELAYRYGQRVQREAMVQLGKLLGHSELFGNPLGLISSMGTGVAGFVRGVGRGVARGDGDEIVRSGGQLMGHVVGGFAAAGARLTGSLHAVAVKLGGPERAVAEDLRCGGDLKDGMLLGGRGALKTLSHGLRGLLQRPLQGAMQRGTLGLAQGVADGMWGLALSPVAATLHAGTLVLSTVEQATAGSLHAPLPHVRPARSFSITPRLLPLTECMMSSLQVSVHALRSTAAIERGSIYVELSLHEPSFTTARETRITARRTWLQGFRWTGVDTFTWRLDVRSLDARRAVQPTLTKPPQGRRDPSLGSEPPPHGAWVLGSRDLAHGSLLQLRIPAGPLLQLRIPAGPGW